MKRHYILITIATFIFLFSCNKKQTKDSYNVKTQTLKNDTITPEVGNDDLSQRFKQKIDEIDAKANQSNKTEAKILLDSVEDTPVVIWYDNDKLPIKAEYGVTDDGGEFTGKFSFYFINGKLWYSDWIYAKFIFDENGKLQYWMNESWKISESKKTANFEEKEELNFNTLNEMLSKVKLK